jgi:hypothetical protein
MPAWGKKSVERLMRGATWSKAGQGWGAETLPRLRGWRRAIVPQR